MKQNFPENKTNYYLCPIINIRFSVWNYIKCNNYSNCYIWGKNSILKETDAEDCHNGQERKMGF